MSIRVKVISLLSLVFVVLGVLEVAIQHQVLLPSFAALERADAHTAMRRIEFAMEETLQRLHSNAADWGNWSSTWQFTERYNKQFVEVDLAPQTLKQVNVTGVLILDTQGRVLLQEARDLSTGQVLDLGLLRDGRLPEAFPWPGRMPAGRAATGLMATRLGLMLVAAAPILDGAGHGPSRGVVVLCRILTDAEIQAIGSRAQASLMRVALRSPAAGQGAALLSSGGELAETHDITQVYRTLEDVHGQPILTLRVDMPRRISEQGRNVVRYASVSFGVVAVGVLVLLLMILNRLVLSPLAKVTRHAVAIGDGSDLDARIGLHSKCEIGVLAAEFDRMLERLAAARRELVDRAYQSGFAELARGVLHNLGNAMTPLGVRLSTLEQRLKALPAADLEQASAELAGGCTDPQRQAGLTAFLQLGCRELSRSINEAQQDLTVLKRQSAIVQATLSEQLHASRSDHVTEPVNLPELLTQTLEIVPDSCRARLSVEPDETLRGVGVVRTARTVLRLILQNFIINASDAVRDAGRDRGRLRVAAELVRDGQKEKLHLYCEDDGIGIAHENLQKVFERGYSTKSRETNHGLGLHWCANAVSSLGGRIWAASEGVGLGASLHVLVPLNAAVAAGHSGGE